MKKKKRAKEDIIQWHNLPASISKVILERSLNIFFALVSITASISSSTGKKMNSHLNLYI